MDMAHESELYRQLKKAGQDDASIKEFQNIIDNLNNGVYIFNPVLEHLFDEFHLWKFIKISKLKEVR